jgi:hypothetical protein
MSVAAGRPIEAAIRFMAGGTIITALNSPVVNRTIDLALMRASGASRKDKIVPANLRMMIRFRDQSSG